MASQKMGSAPARNMSKAASKPIPNAVSVPPSGEGKGILGNTPDRLRNDKPSYKPGQVIPGFGGGSPSLGNLPDNLRNDLKQDTSDGGFAGSGIKPGKI
jgi:hypothetical protein